MRLHKKYNYPTTPKANKEAIVLGDKYRFTILTPRLLRIEYNEDGYFEDNATQTVINRVFDVPNFTVEDTEGLLKITTECIELTYTKERFSQNSLSIQYIGKNNGVRAGTSASIWYFNQNATFDGTTRTLDATGKEIFDKVEELRRKIVTEFNGDGPTGKRGNGKQIGLYLEEINKILNSNIQQDPRYNSSDSEILNKYHAEINVALNSALKPHTITASTVSKARTEKNRLTAMNDSIQIALAVGNISEEEIKQVEKLLADGYNTIQSNNQFVEFDSTTDDEEVYTRENGVTRTKRMSSVIEVFFVDFLQGKYPSSFWYYVILSILVDIAAFIFFDIAFKEESDFI